MKILLIVNIRKSFLFILPFPWNSDRVKVHTMISYHKDRTNTSHLAAPPLHMSLKNDLRNRDSLSNITLTFMPQVIQGT